MRRLLMKRHALSPIWTGVGIALLVIAGLLLSRALLDPGPVALAPARVTPTASSTATTAPTTAPPDTATPEPSPTVEPLAATVNGYTITRSYLSQTVQLNKVLGEVSGASVLGEEETLQRLITSQLILDGAPDPEEPTEEEIESVIASLEQDWRVSDEVVAQRLQEAGVERAFLVDSIKRLLTVQASLTTLEKEGHDLGEWLARQREDAQITIFEGEVSAERTDLSPTAQTEPPTATPGPEAEVPEIAPGFTLSRAGGGSFTLEDQLQEGPVVLVFFERCG
jgi:hypothetical protein